MPSTGGYTDDSKTVCLMTKKLFRQMWNERRTNAWLLLELIVVSVVLWYVVDTLYCRLATYGEPRGFDTEHCYLLELGKLRPGSPDYVPGVSPAGHRDAVLELCERIRRRPGVEAVSLSLASYPYNGSNNSIFLGYDSLRARYIAAHRMVSPDFLRVFRYRGAHGEPPELLASVLERGDVLVSDNLFDDYGVDMDTLVGRTVHSLNSDGLQTRVGALIEPVRYSDFHEARHSLTLVENLESYYQDVPGILMDSPELCLRMRPESDKDVAALLMGDSDRQLRVGNLYVRNVRSFADIRRSYQLLQTTELRNLAVVMGFLLLNVFLGLLGTFWFRTQQRRGELALHRAMGARCGQVFGRLVGEGLVLLAVTFPVALAVGFNVARAGLSAWYGGTTLSVGRLFVCLAVAFVLMGAVMVAGMLVPALRAMRVSPVEGLHEE